MTTPDVLPRATQHIDAIVGLIATLLERYNAYRTDDGSIFFRSTSGAPWRVITTARIGPP